MTTKGKVFAKNIFCMKSIQQYDHTCYIKSYYYQIDNTFPQTDVLNLLSVIVNNENYYLY